MLWNTSEFRQRNTSSPEAKTDNSPNNVNTPDRATRPAKHNLYGYRTPPRSSLFSSSWTFGQAVLLAALCSSISAILTAVVAIYCFADVSGSQVAGVYSDQLVTTRITRSASSSGLFDLLPHLEQQHPSDTTPVEKLPSLPVKEPSTKPTSSTNIDSSSAGFAKSFDTKSWPAPVLPSTTEDDGPRPQVAWLMSFPNRYVVVDSSHLSTGARSENTELDAHVSSTSSPSSHICSPLPPPPAARASPCT